MIRAPALKAHALRWLRRQYPDALLVPELCVGNWGAASIDVAAVTEAEIIGIEVKGVGDSPSRLERQGIAYGMVASRMWLLPTPSLEARCWKARPAGWGRLVIREGECVVYVGDEVEHRPEPTPGGGTVYKPHKIGEVLHRDSLADLVEYYGARTMQHASGAVMLGVLWADELRTLWAETQSAGLVTGKCPSSADHIRPLLADTLPLSVIRPFLCRTLRARRWERGPMTGGGKTVFRPGDALPDITAPEMSEVPA